MSSSSTDKILILDETSGDTKKKSFKEHCEDPVNSLINSFTDTVVRRNGDDVHLQNRFVTLKGGGGPTAR